MHEGEQGGVRCVRGSRGGARVAQKGGGMRTHDVIKYA